MKKPTVAEIAAYCHERQNRIDPEAFFDFYESKGWLIGRSPMKCWKAAVRTWERRQRQETAQRCAGSRGSEMMAFDDPERVRARKILAARRSNNG